jgi:hypothetical protein
MLKREMRRAAESPAGGAPIGVAAGAQEVAAMKTLNDPVPMDDAGDPNWSPRTGLVRAAGRGAVVSLVLAVLSVPLAWYFPGFLLNLWVRMVLAFGLAWVMFGVVQRAAGMVGAPCTALAVIFTIVVLVSQHVVFALHGVPTLHGTLIGWQWLTLTALGTCNFSATIGIWACGLLCHSGAGDFDLLAWIMNLRVWGRWS